MTCQSKLWPKVVLAAVLVGADGHRPVKCRRVSLTGHPGHDAQQLLHLHQCLHGFHVGVGPAGLVGDCAVKVGAACGVDSRQPDVIIGMDGPCLRRRDAHLHRNRVRPCGRRFRLCDFRLGRHPKRVLRRVCAGAVKAGKTQASGCGR